MSRSFGFHPDARLEFREAVRFYESERRGVGAELIKQVRSVVAHVLAHPLSGSPAEAGTRKKVLAHFPYTLVYLFEDSQLTIVAVAHQRRRPGYWRERLATQT